MSKLVVIGGGSTIFVRTLISDLLTFKENLIDTISLVDINKEKLELMDKFV